MGSFRAMQPISKTEVPVWYEGFCSHEKKGRCQRVRATPFTQKDAKGPPKRRGVLTTLLSLALVIFPEMISLQKSGAEQRGRARPMMSVEPSCRAAFIAAALRNPPVTASCWVIQRQMRASERFGREERTLAPLTSSLVAAANCSRGGTVSQKSSGERNKQTHLDEVALSSLSRLLLVLKAGLFVRSSGKLDEVETLGVEPLSDLSRLLGRQTSLAEVSRVHLDLWRADVKGQRRSRGKGEEEGIRRG